MEIKAIETTYSGYKFRSRLEARWAVFFKELGLEFEYEPEGFLLDDDVKYLPDFFLPILSLYVEVKPSGVELSKSNWKKLNRFGQLKDFLIVFGEPYLQIEDPCNLGWERHWPITDKKGSEDGGSDSSYVFCVCPWCGKIGVEFDGRGARVCGYKIHGLSADEARAAIPGYDGRVDDKIYTYDDPKIVFAANMSRQARFEHGECG